MSVLRTARVTFFVAAAGFVTVSAPVTHLNAQAAPAQPPANAKIWVGRAAEIEQYLRTVEVVKLDDLSVGVTKPKKATLPPGGPTAYFAWKSIAPGRYSGFWENY